MLGRSSSRQRRPSLGVVAPKDAMSVRLDQWLLERAEALVLALAKERQVSYAILRGVLEQIDDGLRMIAYSRS
jgi:hypothetical protein